MDWIRRAAANNDSAASERERADQERKRHNRDYAAAVTRGFRLGWQRFAAACAGLVAEYNSCAGRLTFCLKGFGFFGFFSERPRIAAVGDGYPAVEIYFGTGTELCGHSILIASRDGVRHTWSCNFKTIDGEYQIASVRVEADTVEVRDEHHAAEIILRDLFEHIRL